ncbi:MAG: polymerase, partial [Gaiellales bacterium]|nr:polymerase [Gaiellales bacterium]
DTGPLFDTAIALLRRTLVAGRGVRLIGLTAISLTDAQQLTLFGAPEREDRIARSIDAVRERFGNTAITRARLLTESPHRRFDFGERPQLSADELDEEP